MESQAERTASCAGIVPLIKTHRQNAHSIIHSERSKAETSEEAVVL